MNRPFPWLALFGVLLIALSAGLPLFASQVDPNAAAEEAVAEPSAKDAEAPDEAVTKAANQLGTSTERQARVIPETPEGGWDVYVVPIEGTITDPQLFILKRALKEAISNDVDIIVFDMDTPGGAGGVMLEMMEALNKFPGDTITFVNDEAISAGAFIAVATDDIWFNPKGVMGAAAVVMGNGQDLPPTMRAKVDSLIDAKVRMMSEEYRYRSDVMRAMSQEDYELKIDGETIPFAQEGKLLTVTATEAYALYGSPPQPLLATGIAENVEDLLDQKLGAGNYQIKAFEVTWSEDFAKWFKGFSPALLGIGMLLLFIEMKTPSFGIIGMAGVCLLLLVFASNYFAGMAGNEEILLFAIGVVLIAVEIFLIPGTLIAGLLGAVLVFGSLLWAMADIWPKGSEGFEMTPRLFYEPVAKLALGFVITIIGAVALMKLLPQKWLHGGIILGSEVGDPSVVVAGGGRSIDEGSGEGLPEPGARGEAVTDMHPGGQVEIDGRRFQARLAVGSVDRGAQIEVVDRRDFSLVVRVV